MNIKQNIEETIGNTPMVYLRNIAKDSYAKVAVKLEYMNPGGSVKDRIAYSMLLDAEKDGRINKDTVIIEATSGNTGIGLAMICASKGYRIVITMPDSMSLERRKILQAFGAELVLTPAAQGMTGAKQMAIQIAESLPNSYIPEQFSNKSNVEIHKRTTAEEIWRDTDGQIDIFVAGVGTGGTITGVSEKLKPRRPNLKIVAVEPAKSPVISGGEHHPHAIAGIGAGFIPAILNVGIIDEIMLISDEEAIMYAKRLMKEEGLMCGISSGANVAAAMRLALMRENEDKLIVTILPSPVERYLSTILFNPVV